MSYTQQQIADLFGQLFPKITESETEVKITLKGNTFNIPKPTAAKSVNGRRSLEFK